MKKKMKQIHYVQDYARDYGVLEAILLDSFYHLHGKNQCDPEKCFDGGVWFYYTYEAWHKYYPEFSKKFIYNALEHLIELGFIMKGCYEKVSYSKKSWWSLTESGLALYEDPDSVEDFIEAQIPAKKKTTTKKSPKKRPDVEPKWNDFLDFIEGEFSIMYPEHKNKAAAIQAGYVFTEDVINYGMSKEDISDLVKKIQSHYLLYCKEKGKYSLGPKRYLEERAWTQSLETQSKPDKDRGAKPEDHADGPAQLAKLMAKIKGGN